MFAEIIRLLSSPTGTVASYLDGEIYIDPITPPGWTPCSHNAHPSRASARRDSGFKASKAPRPFPRHGPAAATTGTRAGICDTDAPGKRDHGELAAKRLS